jgi:hypothetical protein
MGLVGSNIIFGYIALPGCKRGCESGQNRLGIEEAIRANRGCLGGPRHPEGSISLATPLLELHRRTVHRPWRFSC